MPESWDWMTDGRVCPLYGAAIGRLSKPQFAVRAQSHQLQTSLVGQAIYQHQVWPDVAIAVVFPVTRKTMITVARFQSSVIGKGHNHSSEISLQGEAVLPFGFALEVPFELACAFNRPHSDRP